MPDDIYDLIFDAWFRIRDRLESDPRELQKRLARRARPMLTRPPRAWCLAVRASDHRIPTGFYQPQEHEVTLDADLLRKLCAPVYLDPPGQTLTEVAKKLGTSYYGLLNARLKKIFAVHHVEGLGGYWGKPVPLLYTKKPLDPGAKDFAAPIDPIWACTAENLDERIWPELTQTLTRVPCYRPTVWKHRYDENRHPELEEPHYKYRNRRLPPPEPDYVWYKWSRSGHFLGDEPSNWRKGPKDDGERPPKWRVKKRYKRRPRPSVCDGTDLFHGFAWICPLCRKTCRTVYFPLPSINLLAGEQPLCADEVPIARPERGFACARCHRVNFLSSVSKGYWNDMITYLTSGLLYGREVQKPSWLTPQRKRAYKPLLRAAPKRDRVYELLLQGHPRGRIAFELKMTKGAVDQQTWKIFKQHGVRTQRALLLKHKKPLPPRLTYAREKVLDHIRAGRSQPQIAAALGITRHAVQMYTSHLRKSGQLPRPSRKRDAIAALLADGLSNKEIARRLGMTIQQIYDHRSELRRAGKLPIANPVGIGAAHR